MASTTSKGKQLLTDLPAFDSRFQHAHNKIGHHIPEAVRAGKFLDIGCGMGNAVIAALKHGAAFAVGIDRDLSEFGHHFSGSEFPAICAHYDVEPRRALLLEADVFDIGMAHSSFDYAMMLDSIEHVPNPEAFIRKAHSSLRVDGYFLIDTCPLYFSQAGHHLFNHFAHPWVHFRKDFQQMIGAVDDWSRQRFDELNKVTHQQLVDACIGAGFTIDLEHRGQESPELRSVLEACRDELDLDGIDEQTLFEDWILLVCRKTR